VTVAICSKCGDVITLTGDERWYHVKNGRMGLATWEDALRHLELGCYNRALPEGIKVDEYQ